MFEQEYKRANDRIHPRKDLLKEMEANWAAEEAKQAEEESQGGKVVAFPTWARYASMAAGILLCVGLGMGSVLLFARGRGMQNKTASAEAPQAQMAESMVAPAEAKIVTTTTAADMAVSEESAMGAEPEAMLMTSAYEAPQGMHPAADEAEVEDAVLYGSVDRGEAEESMELNAAAPKAEAKTAAAPVESRYPAGQILGRDDLMTVFLPTSEQVRVIQYANRRVTNIFSLGLRESGAQVQRLFWIDSEMVAVRERNGDTELLRFDVTDWKSPRHLKTLTQSGSYLGAWEMGGKLCVLSLYGATDQEPLPWVNGERMDFADVLLDSQRPGDVFTVLTVYDPAQGDGFAAQTALLTQARGVTETGQRLFLWAGTGETDLYAFLMNEEGLALTAECALEGTVLSAGSAGEGLSLLLQQGDDVTLLTLDADLQTASEVTANGLGRVSWGRVYEEGTVVLTDDALHWITASGESALAVTGDGFLWLTPDRGLVFTADGKLQLVELGENGFKALGTADARNSLALLLEDPSRVAYDMETGRLLIPAGQTVYQYKISETGEMTIWGSQIVFSDHDEKDQREIRCLLTADGALVFYRSGVILCSPTMERLLTTRY